MRGHDRHRRGKSGPAHAAARVRSVERPMRRAVSRAGDAVVRAACDVIDRRAQTSSHRARYRVDYTFRFA